MNPSQKAILSGFAFFGLGMLAATVTAPERSESASPLSDSRPGAVAARIRVSEMEWPDLLKSMRSGAVPSSDALARRLASLDGLRIKEALSQCQTREAMESLLTAIVRILAKDSPDKAVTLARDSIGSAFLADALSDDPEALAGCVRSGMDLELLLDKMEKGDFRAQDAMVDALRERWKSDRSPQSGAALLFAAAGRPELEKAIFADPELRASSFAVARAAYAAWTQTRTAPPAAAQLIVGFIQAQPEGYARSLAMGTVASKLSGFLPEGSLSADRLRQDVMGRAQMLSTLSGPEEAARFIAEQPDEERDAAGHAVFLLSASRSPRSAIGDALKWPEKETGLRHAAGALKDLGRALSESDWQYVADLPAVDRDAVLSALESAGISRPGNPE